MHPRHQTFWQFSSGHIAALWRRTAIWDPLVEPRMGFPGIAFGGDSHGMHLLVMQHGIFLSINGDFIWVNGIFHDISWPLKFFRNWCRSGESETFETETLSSLCEDDTDPWRLAHCGAHFVHRWIRRRAPQQNTGGLSDMFRLAACNESTSQAAFSDTFQHLKWRWMKMETRYAPCRLGIPIDPNELRSGHAWLRCIAFSTEVPGNFFVAKPSWESVDSEDGMIGWALGNPWLEVADGLIEIGSICLAAGLDWRNHLDAAVKHVWCFDGDFFSVKVVRQTGKWIQMLVHRIKFAEPAANILVYTLQVASHRIELAFENSQLKHGGRAMPLLSIFDLDFFLSRSYQAHLCLSPFMPCWKPTRGWQWYWLHRIQGHSHHFTSYNPIFKCLQLSG